VQGSRAGSRIEKLVLASWQWARLPRDAKSLDQFDVVHATSLAIPPTSKPLVVTVHDVIFLDWPSAFTPYGRVFHRRGLQLACRLADALIVPSRAVGAKLVSLFPDLENKIFIAPHGVPRFCRPLPDFDNREGMGDSKVSTPQKVQARPLFGNGQKTIELASANKPRILLWVGTIEPRKNLPRLLKAFGLLVGSRTSVRQSGAGSAGEEAFREHDLVLVLVGRKGWGISFQSLALPQLRERLGSRVLFVEEPDDPTLSALYRHCEVVVLPSLDEGFGFPLLEAMAHGAPVVASRIPAFEEVGSDAVLYFDPNRVASIAEALATILDDPDSRTRLQQAGLERAAAFDWEQSVNAHREAYLFALETHGRRWREFSST
jgi:glycosyltransferase involved in cell wall biosynthesis